MLNFLERKADQVVRGEHTTLIILFEVSSELNSQELKIQCTDRALHESDIQLHSQRMEHHGINSGFTAQKDQRSVDI